MKTSIHPPRRVQIYKRKYDGSLWGTFSLFVLFESPEQVVYWQPRGTRINRHTSWTMRNDHLRFFYPGRWYAIAANYKTEGLLHHCYCDIIAPWQPPAAGDSIVTYIDLELDLHVEPSGRVVIHDEDEFEQAVIEMHYPPELQRQAREAVDALAEEARQWSGPFAGIPLQLSRYDMHQMDTASQGWREMLVSLKLEPPFQGG
jgi:protein associated with RNAse G/E